MSPRVRVVGPWLVVAAVIAVIVCAVGWPTPTGWAVGGTVGAAALVHGGRQLLEERREKTAPRSSTCAGCIGCGGPDCIERPEAAELCPTPETHNWGCGCPTDQAPIDQTGQQ